MNQFPAYLNQSAAVCACGGEVLWLKYIQMLLGCVCVFVLYMSVCPIFICPPPTHSSSLLSLNQ